MLFNLTPERLIANLIALLIGMTVHEFAHNYVGYLMGDPVPKQTGRLTLNPFVHINWFGWLLFAIIGFGILGSAPISPYRMRNPRWGFLAAVAAGPFSNLLVAVVFALFIWLIGGLRTLIVMPTLLSTLFIQIVVLNVSLFVFNLIPLFPVDGWHIVLALLPPNLAYTWQRHQQTSMLVFGGLVLISLANIRGLDPLGILIFPPINAIASLLLGF